MKNQILFLTLLLCSLGKVSFSQSYRSAYGWTSSQVQQVVTDSQNNTYVAGFFYGTQDFDTGIGEVYLSTNDMALFICKYNSAGNLVFARKLPTHHGDVQLKIDFAGNIYVASNFYETVDLDPGSGFVSVTSLNNFQVTASLFAGDVYIVKLNSSGNFVWGQRFGTIYSDGIDIDLNNNNNLIVAITYIGLLSLPSDPAFSFNTGSDSNIALFKLNSTGTIDWVHNIGGLDDNEWASHVEVTPNNEILLTGAFFGTTDLDGEAGVAEYTATLADAFIVRYNTIGNFLNARVYGGPGNQFGQHAFERNGSLYAEILYDTQIDVDTGPDVFAFAQDSVDRYVFLKDSLDTGLQWAIEIPFGDGPPPASDQNQKHLFVDAYGNMYAGFYLRRPTQVTINGQTSTITPLGLNDAILCKVNANGTIAWYKKYGKESDENTSNGYAFSVEGVTLKSPNKLIFCGSMQGSCDFDLGIGDGTVTVNNSAYNGFLTTLELTPDPGDLDGDGEVTSLDVQLFLDSMGCTSCPNLDLNNDNIVTVSDLMLYIDLIDG